ERLERLIEEGGKNGKPVLAHCVVKAHRKPSTFENVTARIPGETEEEVLLIAHLCHPRGSANDNLSGVAAALEAARALKQAIAGGLLPVPKRSIRILLVPEYLGSYAYVSQTDRRGKEQAVGGLDLDMVGSSQNNHNGPLSICDTPGAAPSFVTALAWAIHKTLQDDECITSKHGFVPLFTGCFTGFRGGSDHAVFSDPVLRTPTPMLGQEPDFLYHTSGDLPETLDPFILTKSATLAAVYAYTLAALSERDVRTVLGTVLEMLSLRLTDLYGQYRDALFSEEAYLAYTQNIIDRTVDAVADLTRFFPGKETSVRQLIARGQSSVREAAALQLSVLVGEETASELAAGARIPVHPNAKPFWDDAAYAWTPARTFVGPVHDLKKILRARGKSEEAYEAYVGAVPEYGIASIEHQLEYYIDGKRTCAEIVNAALLESQGARDFETLYKYLLLLEEAELIVRRGKDGI
ncbi:MAG: DUF4910 domain-containing protein, partial [Clostridiales Family XIII bacterium]|nr:DUF4910 domain-containing protein [Clostridiales Family XIII bacterium]